MTSILGGAMLAPVKARFGARNSMMAAAPSSSPAGSLRPSPPMSGSFWQDAPFRVSPKVSWSPSATLWCVALRERGAAGGWDQAITWALAVMLGPLLGGWRRSRHLAPRLLRLGDAADPDGLDHLRNRPHIEGKRHRTPLMRLRYWPWAAAIACADNSDTVSARSRF
jgi:hypothetical protein